VIINGAMPEAPFGGIKQSGFGKAMGDDSLREMCDTKHINVDRMTLGQNPLGFPYTEKSYGWFKKALRLMYSGGSLVKRIGELF
jgi:succinate-semialdehyde dehydrogenase/glutarate-semialdehyde dehydrogenase